MSISVEWKSLAQRLSWQYPENWQARFAAFAHGTDSDQALWRKLGGTPVPGPTPFCGETAMEARNRRMAELFSVAGLSVDELAERFDLRPSQVVAILNAKGIRVRRK